jgi:hypothetical protein
VSGSRKPMRMQSAVSHACLIRAPNQALERDAANSAAPLSFMCYVKGLNPNPKLRIGYLNGRKYQKEA